MSDQSEKDPSKEKFLSDHEEIKKAIASFRNELISNLWGITSTGERQQKIKEQVITQRKVIDKLCLKRDKNKSLYEKYKVCKSDEQKMQEWRREFTSIDQKGQISQEPKCPPSELTNFQTAAAILEHFEDEKFESYGYDIDEARALKNKHTSKDLKPKKSKPATKKAVSPSKPVKEAPKPPSLVTRKIKDNKMPWTNIFSQIPKDKDGVVSLPEDKERIVSGIEALVAKKKLIGMAFDKCRQDRGNEQLVIKVDLSNEPDPDENDIWFLGDIHGDLLGMTAAIDYVEQTSRESGKKPIIIYLGDFFDRGEYGHWVLVKLFSQILGKNRSHIGVIAGNHDEGLKYSKERGFYSEVKPGEFADWLNDQPEDSVWPRLGQAAIKFFKRMPRAIFMPDGLLIAHGGVPHTDLPVESFEQLNEPAYLQDFVWTRAHERAPKRIPNRNTKGCSFGREDFSQFCRQAEKVLPHPVQRMLRGHDHYLEGFRHYEKYVEHPILTLNTRCYQPDMMKGPYSKSLCVARWVRGKLPEVHIISVPKVHLNRVYSKSTAHAVD